MEIETKNINWKVVREDTYRLNLFFRFKDKVIYREGYVISHRPDMADLALKTRQILDRYVKEYNFEPIRTIIKKGDETILELDY